MRIAIVFQPLIVVLNFFNSSDLFEEGSKAIFTHSVAFIIFIPLKIFPFSILLREEAEKIYSNKRLMVK